MCVIYTHIIFIIFVLFQVSEKDETPPESTSPIILVSGNLLEGKFDIVAEGIQLHQSNDFVKAVGLLMSFFYTLNVKYPLKVTNTLKFLQNSMFKIRGGGSIPQKVQTLMNKIN